MRFICSFKFIPWIILFFSLFSCERDAELDLRPHHAKLCLNCILETGSSTITAYLTKSTSANFDSAFYPVKNATITLLEESVPIGTFSHVKNDIYRLNYIPKAGKRYKIKAEVYGEVAAEAETEAVNLPNAKIEYMDLKIVDPKWEKGYYTRSVFEVSLTELQESNNYWLLMGNYSTSNNSKYLSLYASYMTDQLFFDEFNSYQLYEYSYPFANKEYLGGLRLNTNGLTKNTVTFLMNGLPNTTVFIFNCDKNFDKYYKSSIKNYLTEKYDQFPILEPVKIFSNIQNGYGIFGSIALVEKKFNLQTGN